jgi:phosphate transport system permease protein
MVESELHQAVEPRRSLARDPQTFELFTDQFFRGLCTGFSWLTVLLVVWIVGQITIQSLPAIRENGLDFITGRIWDPNMPVGDAVDANGEPLKTGVYGILPHIWGTLYSSVLGLIIGSIFGIAVAVFLSEGFLSAFLFRMLSKVNLQYHRVFGKIPDAVEEALRNLIQLLAAIPSVVYGLWGIFVLIPLMRPTAHWLNQNLGWVPFFNTDLGAKGMFPAALILGIMVLPTIAAISRDALVAVPPRIREAAYGLGATRWEALFGVIIPTASTGIYGSIILAFGRALGETMALAMLVGSMNTIELSLFSPANTLAALLANNFREAGADQVPNLMYAALVLLAITLVVNIAGAWILNRSNTIREGVR